MRLPKNRLLTFARRAVRLFTLSLLPIAFAHAGETGFDWNKWAEAANESPCKWLPAEQMASLLGGTYPVTETNSRTGSSCQWKTAEGNPVLSMSINSSENAGLVKGEREAQLTQIQDYGTGRFEPIEAPAGVVTAIIRKDRLIVSLFPNSDAETATLVLQGHPILREGPDLKKVRKERLLSVTQAVIERFKF
ncbi:MAG: hypothetical protein IPM37_08035 [Hahellaceae bacterium]|nr:hypothetical protein [Hahellaceae bacterium]